jgi:hypothetical protein
MGLKDLFLVSDEGDKKPENKEVKFPNQVQQSFPQSQQSFPQNQSFSSSNSFQTTTPFQTGPNEYLSKFVEMYQNGFGGLNLDGYDFYEFYQAIEASGGIDNPQMYAMAMTMANAMDKSVTKSKLLNNADYYLSEINKIYTQQVTNGNLKRQELITQKESENRSLSLELSNLKEQLQAISNQIQTKENQLSLIDNKYEQPILDINKKIDANEIAKNSLVEKISKIKNGINNYINQ